MSRKKRELSAEEKALWRRVASTVKPRRRVPLEPETEEPPTRATPAPVRPAPKPSTPAVKPTRPTAPPANCAGEKRVRRGKLDIDATLDLHGHTQDSGRAVLARFLNAASRRGARTVIVVTGAGRAGEGVLKRRLPDWLAELKPIVSGYAPAHRAHGGAGAFYVFLKRSAK